MTARWKAVAAIDPDVLAKAAQLECAFTDPDRPDADAVQCQLGDIPHVFHAAFLRDGAQREPCSDVFLRWHQDMPGQWAQDLAVCLSKRTPLGDVCTIFRDHPGPCEWQQTDPLDTALSAYADQLIQTGGRAVRAAASQSGSCAWGIPMLLDIRTPRPEPANPDTCRVCRQLRQAQAGVIEDGYVPGVRSMLVAMRIHLLEGHPDDPRNAPSGDGREPPEAPRRP